MMSKFFKLKLSSLLCFVWLGAGALFAANAWADESTAQLAPDQLMSKVSQDILKELEGNRAKYRSDPIALRQMIDKILLPHFDTQFAAQRVLARNWKDATPDQRKRFIEAFYQSLLQGYGEAIVDFTADRLKILPFRDDPNGERATVRSQIKRDNGSLVAVNYAMRKTPDGWKAWDVIIEGVSYVVSLQKDFAAEIQQKGIDGVIQRLEAQNKSGVSAKPKAAAAS
jgi:phospholipid transport system substrate-binding protein